jgi:hypothetical protein
MLRKILSFISIPTFASAHDGLHFHPHGAEFGWLIAALIALAGGVVLAGAWRK